MPIPSRRHRRTHSPGRRLAAACALVLAAGVATGVLAQACPPAAPGDLAEVAVFPKWSQPGQPFEGWGTALAWFGNVTGRLPDAGRTRLADLLYGRDGLRLNIARYNIGGGDAPDTPPYLRRGADVPGFWRAGRAGDWTPGDETAWDWSADPGQRWWLDAVRDRAPDKERIFEAFSNSPPWFMTVSGRVSGNTDGLQDNLRPGEETRFAAYLVRVTAELEKRHHIVFRTLSPVNEPGTPYWYAANTQEGAHWSPTRQGAIVKAVRRALDARGMTTEVAAVDETNAQTFMVDWAGLDDDARAAIAQINVHSYDTTGKTAVRDLARQSGKRLWMSEVDLSPPNVPQDFDDMRPAIALGEQVVSDINRLQPVAWVFWQAVENEAKTPDPGSNWGLIKLDFAAPAPAIHVTQKYWTMGNFTRYIRPGDRFVPVDDGDTVVAETADGGVVAVHVNPGLLPRRLQLALPRGGAWRAALVVSDANRHLEAVCETDGAVIVPPMSITTVLYRQ